MFAKPCRFVAGAASIASLPVITHPEIAFAGRSNVGKSSLINALIGQKHLVKTSKNPGHTKQLNFFLLDERLMLVDMPGYGYAKVSKEQKSGWDKLIHAYLAGRPNLKRICLLIDARRGVMPVDESWMDKLNEAAVSFQVILTKADQLTDEALKTLVKKTDKLLAKHPAAHPEIIATSAQTAQGIENLQEQLASFSHPL